MARRTASRKAARRGPARTQTRSSQSSLGRSLYHRRLRLEPLEDRRLLALVTVTTLADSIDFTDGVTSLREAIFATNTVPGPDTIDFAPALTANGPATILLSQGELRITDSLTIYGPGADLLTIDASGSDPTPDQDNGDGTNVFVITNPVSAANVDADLTGLTITGGDDSSGAGGIANSKSLVIQSSIIAENSSRFSAGGISNSGNLMIVDSQVVNNTSLQSSSGGGGIRNSGGSLHIVDSLIANNRTLGTFSDGGGIFNREGVVTLINSTVANNRVESDAAEGGGIFNERGDLTIDGSTITGNTSSGSTFGGGGGITNRIGNVTITDSIIAHNSSREGGGGIFNRDGVVHVSRSTISHNTAFVLGYGMQQGGGFHNDRGTLVIESSTISNNRSDQGGAIYSDSTLIVRDSSIIDNASQSAGGGIWAGYAEFQLTNSLISGNMAGSGAGLFLNNSVPSIVDSTITANIAQSDGGGIFSSFGASGNVLRTTISDNVAGRDGGGVHLLDATLHLFDSTLSGNHASRDGGAISVISDGPSRSAAVALSNATVSTNSSDGSGGGVFLNSLPVDTSYIKHSTIVLNKSDVELSGEGAGGGIFVARGAANLSNSIVADNTDYTEQGPDITGLFGGRLDASYSLIESETGTGMNSTPVGVPDSNGNLIGRGVALGPLADNGGPTFTHALVTTSQLFQSIAVNAGDPTLTAGVDGVPEFDQRGPEYRRTIGRIDMGAFENQDAGNLILTVDTLADEMDGNFGPGDFSLREAISVVNLYSGMDVINFDASLTANGPATILLTLGRLLVNRSVAINGPGASVLTIDASGNDPTPDLNNLDGTSVFDILQPSFADDVSRVFDVQISGLTLTGGDRRSLGGAIWSRADLTLAEVVIVNNHADFGGGIAQVGRSLTVERSVIDNNVAERRGGAVSGEQSSITVIESRISGNVGRSGGGGIFAGNSELSVRDSTLSGNTTFNLGGAIYHLPNLFFGPGPLSIVNSTISGNYALSESDFGTLYGGAIFHYGNPTATIAHTSIVDNVGGGVYGDLGDHIHHTVVAWNSGFDVAGNDVSISYSLIGSNQGTTLAEAPVGSPDANGNFIGGPVHGVIDPRLGPLADNGGFELPDGSQILTHALLPGSPAINAGDPVAVAGQNGVPVHDQRGAPFIRVYGGRIDIGAVEAIPVGFLPGDYNEDGVVDAGDYTSWRNTMGTVATPPGNGADGNGDGQIDALDYAVWKANYGSTQDDVVGGGGAGLVAEEVRIDDGLGKESAVVVDSVSTLVRSDNRLVPPPRREAAARDDHSRMDAALVAWLDERGGSRAGAGDVDESAAEGADLDDESNLTPDKWDEVFAVL